MSVACLRRMYLELGRSERLAMVLSKSGSDMSRQEDAHLLIQW